MITFTKLNRNRLNYEVPIFAMILEMAIFSFLPNAMAIDTASNNTASNNGTVDNATPIATTNTTFGNPLYTLHEKITGRNVVNSTGNPNIQFTWSGNGMVRGINVTDSGQMLLTYGPAGQWPLFATGHGVITSNKNETIGYTFNSVGNTDKSQTSTFKGIIVFISVPSMGRLAFLGVPNNAMGVYTSEIPSNGNVTTTIWPWTH